MPQYVIIAQDGNDADAVSRRLNIRPSHLQTARSLKEKAIYYWGCHA